MVMLETALTSSSLDSSSFMMSTDLEIVSRFPRSPASNQLPWYLSVSVKAPVKYLFWRRFLLLGDVFGELSGEAGSDLLPRLAAGLKPLGGPSHSSLLKNPRVTFDETICDATRTTDEPHFAASPLKPSSVPKDLTLVSGGSLNAGSVD